MKPQVASRAHLVVDELLRLLRERFAADGDFDRVEVIDGPFVGDESTLPDDVVLVAGATDGESGMVSEVEPQPGLGPQAYVETVETVILISSYSGDEDMAPRRARAAEILGAVKGVVDDNQRTAGIWDRARLGDQTAWTPAQTAAGASCAVGFTVVTQAII